MARMVRKQIYLTAAQAQKLRRTAIREKRTEADVIREALDRQLGSAKSGASSYDDDPLWGIVGIGASVGPSDASERVDDYLYGDLSEFAEQHPLSLVKPERRNAPAPASDAVLDDRRFRRQRRVPGGHRQA